MRISEIKLSSRDLCFLPGDKLAMLLRNSCLPRNYLFLVPLYLDGTMYLSSKITADDDCSHEIKRRLLLGRKLMTNLDSILKSRDITLPTNFHLVKAMVFPVVMYGCENWI